LIPAEGYNDFRENSKKIAAAPLSRMSEISRKIFGSVDLDYIKQKRRENFAYLHKMLHTENKLTVPSMGQIECPLVYPFWSNNGLKKQLIDAKIFVATYWPNVFEWTKPGDLEYELANNVVCIPIDQRYSEEDMERIVKEIRK
jgi:dTDP-4-amino-4,6-dideoxygalactose transaminase